MSHEMNDAQRCPECGGVLVQNLNQKYCPACVMKNALEPSPSELLTSPLDVTQSLVIGQRSPEGVFGTELQPGSMFGDYLVVRRLGRGGMGVVYEAEHLPTARRLALKVMGHSLEDRHARARFLREGRLAASINHPNSVYVYGTEEIAGRPTISMELVSGGTLQQQVKTSGPLPPKMAVDAILQVIEGLEAAYQVGVLHRDVKPNNCFVDANGEVKVGDFGLSIATTGGEGSALGAQAKSHTEITQIGSFLGTPAYASPEQLRGEPLDHRSDIYAVGVTLYFLITGEVPFAADNMIQLLARVLDNPAPSTRALCGNVPFALDHVIATCLRKSPGDRFANYAELRNALLPFSSRMPLPATIGSRFLAGATDFAVLAVLMFPISYVGFQIATVQTGDPMPGLSSIMLSAIAVSVTCLYFALSEWRYGKTIGKRLLGLQVIQEQSKPNFPTALTRSMLYVLPPVLPMFALDFFGLRVDTTLPTGWALVAVILAGWSQYIIKALLFVTARSRNGFAAVHDLLTHTRVIQELPASRVSPKPVQVQAFDAKAGTEMIGPFHILQDLGPTSDGQLVLGYDAKLLRRVWIHRHRSGQSLAGGIDRNLARKTRLRWLGGQSTDQGAWDSYEMVSGKALLDEGLTELDWPTAVTSLADLTMELQLAAKDSSFPASLSMKNLWISESGQVKILPFAVPTNPDRSGAIAQGSAEDVPVLSGNDTQRSLALLQDTATYFLTRFGPTESNYRSISLTDWSELTKIKTTKNLEDARKIAENMVARRPSHVRYRIAGMVAATWVLPIFTVLSMLMLSLLYSRQEAAMPEVRELAEAMATHNLVSVGASQHKAERLETVETYIRTNFRELYHDPSRMLSLYGQTQLSGRKNDHPWDVVFANVTPSPSEPDKLKQEYLKIRSEFDDLLPTLTIASALRPENAAVWATVTWIELVWFPSLITAILFRGGILLQMFGLALVNRRSQRASRLRVFFRMFVTGCLPVLLIVLAWTIVALNPNRLSFQNAEQMSAIAIACVVCVAVIIYRSRQRFFSDRCAGTYLVAR